MASSSSSFWKLFLVLFLVGTIFSSSPIIAPAEARQAKLFFSKYVHASTKTNPNPISQIPQPPASSPAPAPASAGPESQNDDGYGLWGAGSGMVAPITKQTTTTTTTTEATDPTYKDDDELEAALNGGATSSSYVDDNKQYNYKPNGYSASDNNYDDNVYSATTSTYNDDNNKPYHLNGYVSSSSSNYGDNVYPATTTSYNDEEYKSNSYSSSSKYDESKQYNLGGRSQNKNNGNSFSTNYNTDTYYTGKNDETENLAADDSNSNSNTNTNTNTNEYKLGNAQYLTGSQISNNNEGNSFAANYDSNGYYSSSSGEYNNNKNKNYYNNINGNEAVERQGMSDTRFVEGGKNHYHLNDEENKEMMSNYPVNYHSNQNEFGTMGNREEEQQVNWP